MYLVPLLLMLAAASIPATDLTGAWTFEWKPNFSGHDNSIDCQVRQVRQALTIRCNEATMHGTVRGRTVTFEHKTGVKNEITARYKATLDEKGASMTGTWRLSKPEGREGRFEARRR